MNHLLLFIFWTGEAFDFQESKLFSGEPGSLSLAAAAPSATGDKQDTIVNTVLNTIRELSNRLGRMEQLRDCPICGDTVTGV